MLPKTIEQAIGQPPISSLVKSVGLDVLKLQVEYELTVLSTLVSVGGNLNNFSIPFIADQLILMYPNESLADFKLCFQRGAIGAYGNIQRLDGVTIGGWFKDYLEEKYKAIEAKLIAEKDNPYKFQSKEPPKDVLPIEDASKYIDELLESIGKVGNPEVRDDLKRKHADKKASSYPIQRDERAVMAMWHNEWVKVMFDKTGKKVKGYIPFEEWIKL